MSKDGCGGGYNNGFALIIVLFILLIIIGASFVGGAGYGPGPGYHC
ncbi:MULTISPECIES: YjcZ family sporulation protein [Metabacillus]|nr:MULTISPECIES: YjcZ family sporulation protein [Metabacillus]